MNYFQYFRKRTGLLVSVRNADEARDALAGGADFIDVKEPTRGSLGAADPDTISAVVAAVDGRAPVSVAAGELRDFPLLANSSFVDATAIDVRLVKFGLAGCGTVAAWRAVWRTVMSNLPSSIQRVAVVYADWRAAAAPSPEQVLAHAREAGCPAVLVDTWDKSTGTLFDHWSIGAVARFCGRVHEAGLAVVLAGSLDGPSLTAAVQCAPELVAVRGAACDGGRTGEISSHRVQAVRALMNRVNSLQARALSAAPE